MTSRPPWKQLPNLFTLLALVLLVATYLCPFGDLDFGILIRLGERIIQTGQLRPAEGFSYTIAGRDVPDHEWLFELVLWGLWTGFGYGGLKLLKVLLILGTLLVTGLRLRSAGLRWHGIALALGVAIVVLAPGWNLRPLFVTTLGLLLVSWWLHDHCTGKRPLNWWLPVVMFLWANMHPGVITGQGLLMGAILWEWLNRWVKLNTPLSLAACRKLTLIGGAGLAATFVSPDPIGRLLCPLQPEVRHPIMRIFQEMQPLYQSALEPPYVYALVYPVAALVVLTMIRRFRQYRLWEIALFTGLAGLANLATRSVQDWLLVMLCLGVPHLAVLLRQSAAKDRRRPWVLGLLKLDCRCKALFLSPTFRFQWFWPAVGVALLSVVSLAPYIGRDMPFKDRARDPAAAAAWLEEELPADQARNVFAPPDYGAYLVWRLGDRVHCYVDTRGFCFPPELLEDGHYIPQLVPGWEARLAKVLEQPTDLFVLETKGPRGELWQTLKKEGAQPLYCDDQTVILTAAEVRQGLQRLAGNAKRDEEMRR